jgi:hypothetical protein
MFPLEYDGFKRFDALWERCLSVPTIDFSRTAARHSTLGGRP